MISGLVRLGLGRAARWGWGGLLLVALMVGFACWWRVVDGRWRPVREAPTGRRAAFADRMPLRVVWAWERREDLRFLDPARTGVAYLAETLTLTERVSARVRMQPLLLAPGTRVMAVVRVEAGRGFVDSEALRRETAARIVAGATQAAGVVAVQVDFDAVVSQRGFYADVLGRVRAGLPKGMPLSMTALLSWCVGDDWLRGLPVDEAVPMDFRLGLEGRGLAGRDRAVGGMRSGEPLCQGSVGVSTDELPWPAVRAGERLYVFAPRAWTRGEFAGVVAQVSADRE